MTTGFSRARRGGAHARFDVAEATLVISLAGQVVELLRDGVPDPSVAGTDADPLDQLVGMEGPAERPDDPPRTAMPSSVATPNAVCVTARSPTLGR